MTNRRLTLVLVMVLVLVFSVFGLTACDQGGDTTTTDTSSLTTTSSSTTTEHVHAWVEASCTAPRTCSECGETEGDPLPHAGGTATCTDRAVCDTCHQPYGEADSTNHASDAMTYVNNGDGTHTEKHSCCGAAIATEAHSGGTASCTAQATCRHCQASYGNTEPHAGGTATCTDRAVCDTCRQPYGEVDSSNHTSNTYTYAYNGINHKRYHSCCGAFADIDAHYGGTASCTERAVCVFCKTAYGSTMAHKGGTATCTDRAVCDTCRQPYGEVDSTYHTSDSTTYANNGDGTHTEKHSCCGAAIVTEAHSGGTASCTAQAICRHCQAPYGNTEPHAGGTATCTDRAICDTCRRPYGDTLPHRHGQWIVDTQPTCTTLGYRHRECSCGDTIGEYNPALGHDFEITDSKAATCTEDGYIERTCQHDDCGITKRETIYAHGHDFAGGNVCLHCGYEIVIHTHEYTSAVTEPTCTTGGYTTYTCSCGYSYRDSFVDPTTHNWDEGVVTTAKTCTADGVLTYTCGKCDATMVFPIPAGHEWSETVTAEATCTTEGSKTKTCSACSITETEIIPAGHAWAEDTVITAAACTAEGQGSHRCDRCGTTETYVISVLGHHFENGKCTRCDAIITDIVTPDDSHLLYGMYFRIDDIVSGYGPEPINEYGVMLDYNEGATIHKVAVFLTQEGTMWRRCIAVVGDGITYATYVPYLSYGDDIKYSGLNSQWINTFSLRENSDGIWCYSDYATIGVNLTDMYGNLLLSLYDIGQAGAMTRIFTDLDEMVDWLREVDPNHTHSFTSRRATAEYLASPATCTSAAAYYYSCKCGEHGTETFEYGSTLPHAGGNATCTEQAVCDTCRQPYGELAAHTESGWIEDVPATENTEGSKHIECTACGNVLRTETIPATGTDPEPPVAGPMTEKYQAAYDAIKNSTTPIKFNFKTQAVSEGHTQTIEGYAITAGDNFIICLNVEGGIQMITVIGTTTYQYSLSPSGTETKLLVEMTADRIDELRYVYITSYLAMVLDLDAEILDTVANGDSFSVEPDAEAYHDFLITANISKDQISDMLYTVNFANDGSIASISNSFVAMIGDEALNYNAAMSFDRGTFTVAPPADADEYIEQGSTDPEPPVVGPVSERYQAALDSLTKAERPIKLSFNINVNIDGTNQLQQGYAIVDDQNFFIYLTRGSMVASITVIGNDTYQYSKDGNSETKIFETRTSEEIAELRMEYIDSLLALVLRLDAETLSGIEATDTFTVIPPVSAYDDFLSIGGMLGASVASPKYTVTLTDGKVSYVRNIMSLTMENMTAVYDVATELEYDAPAVTVPEDAGDYEGAEPPVVGPTERLPDDIIKLYENALMNYFNGEFVNIDINTLISVEGETMQQMIYLLYDDTSFSVSSIMNGMQVFSHIGANGVIYVNDMTMGLFYRAAVSDEQFMEYAEAKLNMYLLFSNSIGESAPGGWYELAQDGSCIIKVTLQGSERENFARMFSLGESEIHSGLGDIIYQIKIDLNGNVTEVRYVFDLTMKSSDGIMVNSYEMIYTFGTTAPVITAPENADEYPEGELQAPAPDFGGNGDDPNLPPVVDPTPGGITGGCTHPEGVAGTLDLTGSGCCLGVLETITCSCTDRVILKSFDDIGAGGCAWDIVGAKTEQGTDDYGNSYMIMSVTCTECGAVMNVNMNSYRGSCCYIYEYVITLTLHGEVLIDGAVATERSEYHSIHKSNWIELADYTTCGGYFIVVTCGDCDKVLELGELRFGCNLDGAVTSEYTDNSGRVHTVMTCTCPDCGLTYVLDRYSFDMGSCTTEEYAHLTISRGNEVLFDYETLSEDQKHDIEYTYIFHGDSCEDGYTEIIACRNCDLYSTREDSGHRSPNTHIDFAELGACAGYVSGSICEICHMVEGSCDVNYTCTFGEHVTSTSVINGVTHTIATATCTECGMQMTVDTWTETNTCTTIEYSRASMVINGETVFYTQEILNQSGEHNYEYEYKVYGDNCKGGYEYTVTCTDCDYRESGYGNDHIATERVVDLAELGACGGTMIVYECIICHMGEADEPADLACPIDLNDPTVTTTTDDKGFIHTTTSLVCPECGFSVVMEEIRDGEGCNYNAQSTLTVSIGDEVICSATEYYSRDGHNYGDYEFTLDGANCDDGWKARRRCTVCGELEEGAWYSSGHYSDDEYIELPGSCGGYIRTNTCEICDALHYVEYSYNCNTEGFTETEVDNGDGTVRYIYSGTCPDCGLYIATSEWASKTTCTDTYHRYIKVCDASGEVIADYTSNDINHHHEFSVRYELDKDTCDDGYTATHTCRNCDYGYTTHGYGHDTENVQISLTTLGCCDGTAYAYICRICNQTMSYHDIQLYCPGAETVDHGNGYTVTKCAECGAELHVTVRTESSGSCNAYYHRNVSFYIHGKEIASYGDSYEDSHHEFGEEQVRFFGASCTDGYEIYRVCSGCGYREMTGSGYDHCFTDSSVEYMLDPVSSGMCQHHKLKYSICICGNCTEVIIDDMIYTDTVAYKCDECDLHVEYSITDTSEGCHIIHTEALKISQADMLLYESARSRDTEHHSYSITSAVLTDTGIRVTARCSSCSIEKEQVHTVGTAVLQGNGNGTYCCDLNVNVDESCIYTIFSMSAEDTYVTLYRLVDGELIEVSHDDDSSGNGNNFKLTASLEAGSYVFRIRFYSDDRSGEIPYMISVSPLYICAHENTDTQSILAGEYESCKDGVYDIFLCSDCGTVCNINYYTEHVVNDTHIDLTEYGACYGYVQTNSCPCGHISHMQHEACADTEVYELNEAYTDDLGRNHTVTIQICEDCDLRIRTDMYLDRDAEGNVVSYRNAQFIYGDLIVFSCDYIF